jgi:hypothetical protein
LLQTDQVTFRGEATTAILSDGAMAILRHCAQCGKSSEEIIDFFRQLEAVKLLPIKTLTLVEYRARAKCFDATEIKSPKPCCTGRCWEVTICTSFQVVKGEVLKDIDKAYNSALGYCLDCIKHTFCGSEEPTCRVAHDPDSRFLNA